MLDAVVRQWADKARLNKEDAASAGSDVSKAPNSIGVAIATQVLPPMMHDLIQSAPEDQKVRIVELLREDLIFLRIVSAFTRPHDAINHNYFGLLTSTIVLGED